MADLAEEPEVTLYAGRHDESVTVPAGVLERFSQAIVGHVAEDRPDRRVAQLTEPQRR